MGQKGIIDATSAAADWSNRFPAKKRKSCFSEEKSRIRNSVFWLTNNERQHWQSPNVHLYAFKHHFTLPCVCFLFFYDSPWGSTYFSTRVRCQSDSVTWPVSGLGGKNRWCFDVWSPNCGWRLTCQERLGRCVACGTKKEPAFRTPPKQSFSSFVARKKEWVWIVLKNGCNGRSNWLSNDSQSIQI